jgi:NADH-quinone oxidoreductase subunit J
MTVIFALLSLLLLATAVGVVAFRNPVHGGLCLVMNMLIVAALFAMLNAHFLAAVQVIVYAGAVVVLFLFVVMLLNAKLERPQFRDKVYAIVGLGTVAVLFFSIFPLMDGAAFGKGAVQSVSLLSQAPIEGTTANLGRILFTKYLYPFEAASFVLMAALVGAVLLSHAKPQKKIEG